MLNDKIKDILEGKPVWKKTYIKFSHKLAITDDSPRIPARIIKNFVGDKDYLIYKTVFFDCRLEGDPMLLKYYSPKQTLKFYHRGSTSMVYVHRSKKNYDKFLIECSPWL